MRISVSSKLSILMIDRLTGKFAPIYKLWTHSIYLTTLVEILGQKHPKKLAFTLNHKNKECIQIR